MDARLQKALEVLAREDEARAEAALQKALADHEARSAAARAQFDHAEDERLLALRELKDGQTSRMREALEAALPLELPTPCKVRFDVRSSSEIALEIDVPEPSILPTTEAKIAASGKITYKEKNEKKLREQYLRLVIGSTLRHACEATLDLPTCQRVEVRTFRTTLDPSMGKPTRRCVLEVHYDYPTLAPMTMDGSTPFRH